MDLAELKKQSDLSFDIATAKKNALEQAESKQLFAYKDHLFHANPSTINLVHALKQHHDRFFILDANNNPCEITDADNFLIQLIGRNQESLNQYHQLHQQLKCKR